MASSTVVMKTFAICVLGLTACGVGCAHTMSSESTQIREVSWQADVDEYQEVMLSVSRILDSENGAAVGSREELTLEVRPRPDLQYESVLKSVELQSGARARSSGFPFKDVEVRANESRRRVWFVDVASRRVIATLDRDTRATTGPDDQAPSWATVDGGVLLRAAD